MATRSFIAIHNPNNTYTAIYCHFDGYPEGVGHKLKSFYNTPQKIKELVQLGDISALETQQADTIINRYDSPPTTHPTLQDIWDNFTACEYGYIWKSNRWECHTPDGTQYNLYAPIPHPIHGAYYTTM